MSRSPHPDQLSLLAPAELVDEPARRRIRDDLDATLFVEAGAGAGKTTQLSARVVNLVVAGIPIGAIAAITFTEKAAAELRQRIRRDLTDRLATASTSLRPRLAAALDGLDHAAIGTLHAFAARVLREFPVESEVPPSFAVLDEVGSDLAFEQRWTTFQDELLADPELVRLVHHVDAAGIKLAGLRRIARAFGDNWDLVRDRVAPDIAAPDPLDTTGVCAAVAAFLGTVEVPDGDSSAENVAKLMRWHDELEGAFDEFAAFGVLDTAPVSGFSRIGNKQAWRRTNAGEAGLLAFREALAELDAMRRELAAEHRRRWDLTIGSVVRRFTLDSLAERRAGGTLEFHDLLVLARDLVARRPDVRARLHERYERLLLDEFQDTDPIQLELAVRIAADPALPQPDDWREVRPAPGRLFFVGDPKQSIYRFRRADIAQYLRAREQVGADEVLLTTNFRSTPAVLAWVNHTFGRLIRPEPDSQPDFHELDPHWHDRTGSVVLLGSDVHLDTPSAEELRRREAADIAGAIGTALHEGWPVHDTQGSRPCRLGDITVLLPARTSLPALERALRAAGIPYQAENSSLVYATAEIRTLLLAVRAVDDPTAELAVVSTLRSPLYGCSDRDLFDWYQRGGRWRLVSPLPERRTGDDPVHDAMTSLRELVAHRHLLTPSALLQRLVEERRVLELAVAGPGARDVFRRVRFVIDQARAWSDAGGAGLRSYLAWTERQGDDGRYVAEVVLPETDLDAVRIMTIHAAKGLEFPITIVGGMTTKVTGSRGVTVVWPPGTWGLAKGDEHEAFKPVDEQMGFHERLRLLYVACTRAVDHLVVSLHRTPPGSRDNPHTVPSGRLLAEAAEGASVGRALRPTGSGPEPLGPQPSELPWSDHADWWAARAAGLAAASRPRTISATALAVGIEQERREAPGAGDHADSGDVPGNDHRGTDREARTPGGAGAGVVEALDPPAAGGRPDPGLLKDGVDLELPAWQRGRYGTAVGRAVHGVLQAVDLAAPNDLAAVAAAQAAAEGVADRAELVTRLSRAALDAPIVRLAVGRPHWRELYVAAPLGDTLLEGYLDLLVRTDDGLVVVDYKTDQVGSPGDLADKVERYAPQLAVYAVAVEAVLGEPVVGARLVFCATEGATEVPVPSWPAVVEQLRSRLRRGDVATTDGPDDWTTPATA